MDGRLTEKQKRQIAGAVAEVDPAQIAASRHLTIAQKVQQALSMIDFVEEIAAYRLRQRQPDVSEAMALQIVRKADLSREGIEEMANPDLRFRDFARQVLDAVEAAGVEYMIGGAIATAAWGEARTTRDFDLVLDLQLEQIHPLSQELEKRGMLAPPDVMIDLLISEADLPVSVAHMPSGYKAEFFLLRPNDALRASALHRRLHADFGPPLGEVYVHSPEDLIIYKVIYYGLSQQTKHIRDISSIVQTLGDELEMAYIQHWIARLDLQETWREVQQQIEENGAS